MANAVPDNLLFYFLPVGFSCWYFVISSISSDFGRMPYNAFNLQIRQLKKLKDDKYGGAQGTWCRFNFCATFLWLKQLVRLRDSRAARSLAREKVAWRVDSRLGGLSPFPLASRSSRGRRFPPTLACFTLSIILERIESYP